MTLSQTAMIHGEPGERARTTGILRLFYPFLFTGVAIGFFIGLAFPSHRTLAGVGLLLTAAALIWIIRDGLKRFEAFFKGARGEERVAAILAMLPSDYHVFHNVVTQGAETIDHVVIGPTGVFAIETKFWQGRVAIEDGAITINGHRPSRDPVQQVKAAYRHLQDFCLATSNSSLSGQAVVCFANNALDAENPQNLDPVLICNANMMLTLIEQAPARMTRVERDRLVTFLEQKI
jgi:hypothetical protein